MIHNHNNLNRKIQTIIEINLKINKINDFFNIKKNLI